MFTRSYYSYFKIGTVQKFQRVAFTMQCNSEKFQPGQIEILTENCQGINATFQKRGGGVGMAEGKLGVKF